MWSDSVENSRTVDAIAPRGDLKLVITQKQNNTNGSLVKPTRSLAYTPLIPTCPGLLRGAASGTTRRERESLRS